MALHIGERFRDQIDLSNDVQAELELCQLALSSTCEGILMHRPDGTIALFNEACARNLGYTPDEFAQTAALRLDEPRRALRGRGAAAARSA